MRVCLGRGACFNQAISLQLPHICIYLYPWVLPKHVKEKKLKMNTCSYWFTCWKFHLIFGEYCIGKIFQQYKEVAMENDPLYYPVPQATTLLIKHLNSNRELLKVRLRPTASESEKELGFKKGELCELSWNSRKSLLNYQHQSFRTRWLTPSTCSTEWNPVSETHNKKWLLELLKNYPYL